jgi:hypothetical protein
LVERLDAAGRSPRNPVREEPRFRDVMLERPDGRLIELFECREPGRWRIAG